MSLRILTVLASSAAKDTLKALSEEPGVAEFWQEGQKSGKAVHQSYNFLVSTKYLQDLSDKIQPLLSKGECERIIISPVEAAIPRYKGDEEDDENAKKTYGGLTRESLYEQIFKGAETGQDFYILVFLSTLVTAIGLATSNVAVIIGAMVIAPLLGPNLALSFGVALGDETMIRQALKASAVGFGLTMVISLLMGVVWPAQEFVTSHEFLSRTDVGFGGIVLALASGAAAVLSLTSGVSSTMVGVMVAVALMPPAVTLGLSLGAGMFPAAYGAALLLAINITCVNLAAKGIFTLKGIKPRTWYKRKKSTQSLKVSLLFWMVWLLILITLIYLRHYQ